METVQLRNHDPYISLSSCKRLNLKYLRGPLYARPYVGNLDLDNITTVYDAKEQNRKKNFAHPSRSFFFRAYLRVEQTQWARHASSQRRSRGASFVTVKV